MKKLCLLIIGLLFIFPNINVEADMIPISVGSYANEVTIGSTVTYVVTGYTYTYDTGSNMNGKFIYDINYLEYINIKCTDPEHTEGAIAFPEIKITKNTSGEIEFKVNESRDIEGTYQVEITFKVKALPKEGPLRVNFYPETSDVLYGAEYAAIGIKVLGNTTTEDNNEFYYPEDDNTEDEPTENDNEDNPIVENPTKEDSPAKDTKKEEIKCVEDNTFLYVSIASGVLNVLLIILLVVKSLKKKAKETKTLETTNAEIKEEN